MRRIPVSGELLGGLWLQQQLVDFDEYLGQRPSHVAVLVGLRLNQPLRLCTGLKGFRMQGLEALHEPCCSH